MMLCFIAVSKYTLKTVYMWGKFLLPRKEHLIVWKR